VESNRPKSPEAFDFTKTEAAIVWSGSGVCRGISPSNLPGLRSLASALRRTRMTSAKMVVERAKQGSEGLVIRTLVRSDLEQSAVYSGC
jgi:hypothetical protein